MAIEKNSFKNSRLDSELSPYNSRDTIMSSDDDELFNRKTSTAAGALNAVESDDDDDDDEDFEDCDSGAGSDDFDLLELGESGEEFIQVGDQTCSIPFELYDLSSLTDVLSMDVWNEVLSEEERFSLTKCLPDVDHETFMRTLKELLTGDNLHFGSPINRLFEMLKGGLCEPRVALYRQGLEFFQKRQHYHMLRKHQNSMVTNLCQIRDAWMNCKGYSIEEKLRVLNIMKSQKSLMNEKMEEELESESSGREESGDLLWGKRGKDRKQKPGGPYSGYVMNSASDFSSRGKHAGLELSKHGKPNSKGTLKLAGSKVSAPKEFAVRSLSGNRGLETGPYGSVLPLSRHNKGSGFDSRPGMRLRDQMMVDNEDQDAMYEVSVQRDRHFSRVGAVDKSKGYKKGKKHESLTDDIYSGSFMGLNIPLKNDLHSYGTIRTVNQLSDIKVLTTKPANARADYDYGKKVKYGDNVQQFAAEDQLKHLRGRSPNLPLKGSRMELLDGDEPFLLGKAEESFSADQSYKYGEWNVRNKKWKVGRHSPDHNVDDGSFRAEHRGKSLQKKFWPMQNGGRDVSGSGSIRSFAKGEETESDSSEQMDDDEDDNPIMRSKWAYPSGVSNTKVGSEFKLSKLKKNDNKSHFQGVDGPTYFSKVGEASRPKKAGTVGFRADQKGKLHDVGLLNITSNRGVDDNYSSGPGRFTGDGDQLESYNSGRNGHMPGDDGEFSHAASLKTYLVNRKQRGEAGRDHGGLRSNYGQEYELEEADDSLRMRQLAGDIGAPSKLGKKGHAVDRSDVQLSGCSSVSKKRKVKAEMIIADEEDENGDYLLSDNKPQLDDTNSSKKRGKKKLEDDTDNLEKGFAELPAADVGREEPEPETKPQKKPFILITPTVHSGFSFSIIHLLSSVRAAMITLLPEDTLETGKHLDKDGAKEKDREEEDSKQEETGGVNLNAESDGNKSGSSAQMNVPSLTIQEIVSRVRSNPGDPCILETQEPLQDLVRGVLKIFSSRTAPLGAKGWKPLVVYEKSTKTWSWIGPVNCNLSDQEAFEEVTSPDAWGLPHKMLVKVVDCFANWLKNGQETLQQIGSLPAPPSTLMQFNLDEKERFRDLRAQKSLSTINPSSDEVRAYFRKEEVLRYSIPDRAFSYTAVDGKKSIVAPLRRCGGKPTSKARDHFMLKRDRPPHVTILCLVRDAAARLPGSIGTRADVCTLIRDSQYIVEDVSDAQINQVVSGALDRLHYERDPCVQFDGERKLWVYLHREREEEDFEDDGTSSTKKWKRQKKEAAELPDQGAGTVAYHGTVEQPALDLSSELNVDPPCLDDDRKADTLEDDDRDHMEDNIEITRGSVEGSLHPVSTPMTWDSLDKDNEEDNLGTGNGSEEDPVHPSATPMVWETLGLSPMQESKLLCQENSTNEDFDDEVFGRESPA